MLTAPRAVATYLGNGDFFTINDNLYQDPNHSVAEICSMLGISRSTFFRYVKKAESAT